MKIKGYYEPIRKGIIDEKAISELEELKVKCKCGHKTIMPVYINKTMCSYCGQTIYNNTKAYFKYKLRKELNKDDKVKNNNSGGFGIDNRNNPN